MLEARITARGLQTLQTGTQQTHKQTPIPFEIEALRHFLRQSLNDFDLPAQTKQNAIDRLMGFSETEVKALAVRLIQNTAERPDVIAEFIGSSRESAF